MERLDPAHTESKIKFQPEEDTKGYFQLSGCGRAEEPDRAISSNLRGNEKKIPLLWTSGDTINPLNISIIGVPVLHEVSATPTAALVKRKTYRETISELVGHDVDTDEEREYREACTERRRAKFRVEWARRFPLTPGERWRLYIAEARETFESNIAPHIKFFPPTSLCYLDSYSLFKPQMSPRSSWGATCESGICTRRIYERDYRFFVNFSVWGPGKTA